METVRFVAGICGNITALIFFLSPSVTFKRIIQKKSTEEFSSVPYATALLNTLLFSWYGLPLITPNNILLTTVNGIGAAIESVYLVIFLIYAPKKEKLKLISILSFVLTVFSTVAMVSVFALHGNSRKLLCGLAVALSFVIMCASPLLAMRSVIKTKSVEYMPFYLSLCVVVSSTTWFIYGLLGFDPYIIVINSLGGALGLMQLLLYAIYRSKNGSPTKDTDDCLVGTNTEKASPEK